MTLQKKVDNITRKIEDLKSQQHKIESDIAHQILEVIKSQSGFTLPFNAIVGGLLEVIETIRNDPNRSEVWQHAGEKFLKSQHRNNRNNSKNTNRSGVNSTPKIDAKSMDGTMDKAIDKAG